MLKNMKKYSGQAIAIIMIVLVVATVVGASLYSRMIRNTGEIVDTRESQRALEQADSILDVFVSADLPMVQGLMSSALATNNPTKFNTISDLEAFLNNGDGVNDIDITILEEVGTITGWCEPPEKGSSLEVTVSYGDQNSVIEYNVGDVIAINTSNIDVTTIPGCLVDMYFTPRGNGDSLFSTKYVYMDKGTGDVTPYKLTDMELYCVKNTGDVATCGEGSVAPTESLTGKLASGGTIQANPTIANLYEFRILPLKEKLGVSVVPNSFCGDAFSNFVVRAKVTCKGDTREKQVVIPSVNNMGYSALFDYTIYNANGTLNPN